MIKKYAVLLNLIFLFAVPVTQISCGKKDDKAAAPSAMARKFLVTVQQAQIKDLAYNIETVGTLESEEDVKIPAGVEGIVTDVQFREGDQVSTNKVLARIDPERYKLEIDRAEANREAAYAQVQDAQQAYEQRESLRKQDPGWVTQEELRKLQTALDRAKAELSRAQVELSLAKKKYNDSLVRSPFSGIINSKSVATGEYVQSDSVLATIARVQNLKLKFNVAEVDAGRIRVGQDVRFSVRALAGEVFTGKIFFISTTAEPETRMVEVKAQVPNPGLRLRPGYFANVVLQTEVHKDAIVIPEEAVIPTEEGFVSFIVENGTAYQKPIEIGQRSQGEVEILRGIRAGDLVVVRGGHSLSDGMPVEAKTAA